MKTRQSNIRSRYFADIGYQSLNHDGEELCGDHVEIAESSVNDGEHFSKIIVLADGLGSGVKANILAILTSKIISTMLAADMQIEDAVETIAATLPVDKSVNTAFSTFTIFQVFDNRIARIIEYENPNVILIRDGKSVEFARSVKNIDDKEISFSEIDLQENDLFFLMSDGVLYASKNGVYNDKWDRDHVISYMETFYNIGFTAKTLTTILLDETKKLYGDHPTDDATVCTILIRNRETVNLCFGPPAVFEDGKKMMTFFFGREGKHIVCGGTTAKIAADFLGKPVITSDLEPDPEIPPISTVEGIDLVTEGIVTMNRVVIYAKDYLADNSSFEKWSYKKDGASQIARMLFETATDVNLFIGKAVNPAHQNMQQLSFDVKMRLVDELIDCLEKMGKIVTVNYF